MNLGAFIYPWDESGRGARVTRSWGHNTSEQLGLEAISVKERDQGRYRERNGLSNDGIKLLH